MATSIFELFTIGIGPSSSHTVGPMRAARRFVNHLREQDLLGEVEILRCELYGSLGATGKGHGSDKAVLLGLEGEAPDTVDTDSVNPRVRAIREQQLLTLPDGRQIRFVEKEHLILHKRKSLPRHPNGMRLTARNAAGGELYTRVYYSIGGGFIADEAEIEADHIRRADIDLPYPFASGAELLAHCAEDGISISTLMLRNEQAWRDEAEVRAQCLKIWQVMRECVDKGCVQEGILPGGMKVRRRAASLYRQLKCEKAEHMAPLGTMDWVNLYALAVNEENAGGGRVVTAPTNGAAGILPAVMHYYWNHCHGASEDGIVRMLLTAGTIAVLYKRNASISGAEVGCQGEVGSACSMAAAALCEVLGGTPAQVENAAEIGMEHNLGLTCDPVGGLVQVPCIERNAMAAVKAINAARMALRGDGSHFVSLDKVIKTMRDTGMDMKSKYKETARGGLAVNVLDIPVTVIEC